MAQNNKIPRIALERFGKQPDELIPELMRLHKTPFKVALEMNVYPTAIRKWLIKRGWKVVEGVWVEPVAEIESDHA